MIISRELSSFTSPRTATPKVKICGITTTEHALAAAHSGAEMIGMVFAPSRRQVSVEQAKIIRYALESVENPPVLVGVFVNEAPARILAIASEVRLDIVQLSGDEAPHEVAACARYISVIKALRFPPNTSPQTALERCRVYTDLGTQDGDGSGAGGQALPHRLRLLIDSYRPGEYGGTGHLTDWSLAHALSCREEIMLAGGLSPQNARQAVAAVGPWAVDVSSGVETDGVKDTTLIEHFVRAARSADQHRAGSQPCRGSSDQLRQKRERTAG